VRKVTLVADSHFLKNGKKGRDILIVLLLGSKLYHAADMETDTLVEPKRRFRCQSLTAIAAQKRRSGQGLTARLPRGLLRHLASPVQLRPIFPLHCPLLFTFVIMGH
jgi:hypothetical protein